MKNGQFHNTLTVRNLPRVFMGSTIDQGSKAILGKSSQENLSHKSYQEPWRWTKLCERAAFYSA